MNVKIEMSEQELKEKFVDIIRFFEYDEFGKVRIWNEILDDICKIENGEILRTKNENLIKMLNDGNIKLLDMDIENEIWYLV